MHALDRLHLHRSIWATLTAAILAIVITLAFASVVAGAGSQTSPPRAPAESWTPTAAPLVSARPPWAESRAAGVLTWRLGGTLPTQVPTHRA